MLNLVSDKTFTVQYTGFQQGFFLGEEPFYPIIHPEGNVQTIDLSIDYKPITNQAREKGQFLLWQISTDIREVDKILTTYLPTIQNLQSKSFGIAFKISLPLLEGQKLLDHRDELLKTLSLIVADLPENLLLFLQFDLSFIQDLQELFVFLRRDAFFPFQLICSHPELHRFPYASDYIGWYSSSCMGTMHTLKKVESMPLPNGFLLSNDIKTVPLEIIERKNMRFIPASQLTELWEGMDDLFLFKESLCAVSRRKVAGFEAAGGRVHFI